MPRAAMVWIVVATGCGRIGFDLGSSSIDGDGSGSSDDGAGSTFCATVTPPPTLCADFESAEPIETGWTSKWIMDKGILTRADMGMASAHSMLSGFTDHTTAAELSVAYLQYTSPGTTSSVSLALELLLPTRPMTDSVELDDISVHIAGVGDFYNDLDLTRDGSDSFLEESEPESGGSFGHNTPVPTLSAGTWHHLDYTLDLSAHTATLAIDHAIAISQTSYYPTLVPGPVDVRVGMVWALDINPGSTFYFDNVVVRAQ